jgi:hypothetical protein
VTAGVPDVLLWHDGRAFALELKSEAGRVSAAQADMLSRLSEAGVTTAVCRSIDQAVRCLESWKPLRGRLGS